MRIRKLTQCPEIVAGDNTRLRELLHPDRDYPFDGRYSLAHAVLPPQTTSLKHILKSDEIYYILSGYGVMHIDSEAAPVEPGDVIEIPPGATQWLENNSDNNIAFLCIVDPAWQGDDERVVE